MMTAWKALQLSMNKIISFSSFTFILLPLFFYFFFLFLFVISFDVLHMNIYIMSNRNSTRSSNILFMCMGTSLYEGIFSIFFFYIPPNCIIKLLYFIMHINNISIKNQNNSNGTTGVKTPVYTLYLTLTYFSTYPEHHALAFS